MINETGPHWRHRRRLYLAWIVVVAMLFGSGFLNTLHPALDSVSHFRFHLAAILILSMSISVRRRPVIATLCGLLGAAVALCANSAIGFPFARATTAPDNASVLRLLQINIRFDNPRRTDIVALIRGAQADIVLLEEVNDQWGGQLTSLDDLYPYKVLCGIRPTDGVAILSRRSFDPARPPTCIADRSFAAASIDLNGKSVSFAAAHLKWPWPFTQSDQIEALTPEIGRLGPSALLAGDFNATPWSAAIGRIAKAGGLSLVPSLGPTWSPYSLPSFLRVIGLPIDQLLRKGDVVVRSVRKIEAPGSDHSALIVDFTL
ncbi:endonuclease/exonuclease/phosphatase family protein [Mesorhizobium sp. M0514]|uniref:endonuclease/exonuclease/phosphatase family protein n=1 Tax=unclassified Mesorhizobium TaxID=325217 RepID=UPI0012DF53B1|nr:endonuclease/exonuclease/phosphatase family protein [Mesorhizobium sp. L2C085B000]